MWYGYTVCDMNYSPERNVTVYQINSWVEILNLKMFTLFRFPTEQRKSPYLRM